MQDTKKIKVKNGLSEKKEEKNLKAVLTETTKKVDKEYEAKISVIIPVYNMEKYLRKCLDSVITQTYTNLEIICVDDGSTDNSLDILRFYEKKDERIKVFTQKNLGASAARNKALDVATGKYISFVDSDDFLQWNAYEILIEVAEDNDLDLIMFGANTYPKSEGADWVKEKINTTYKVYQPTTYKAHQSTLISEVIFKEKASISFLWLHFLKRSLLEVPRKIRFDETMHLGEDQLFQFTYVPRAKSIMVIEDKLYNYRDSRKSSLMQLYSSKKIQKVENHLVLVEKIIDVWKKEGYYETEIDNLATWAVNFIYCVLENMPLKLKKKYGIQFFEIFKKNNVPDYLIADYEQQHFNEMKEWILQSESDEDEDIVFTESMENTDGVKVSVIIPVYNVEKYLRKCLDSVVTQTYKNLEIICVDDGSTDNSLDILRFYEKKDERIKVFTQENLGPSAARNKALDMATGKYISFVDSDDFLQWNAYEILVTVAEHNNLDLIMFGANTYPEWEGEGWIKDKINTTYKVYHPTSNSEVIFKEKASVPFLWLHFVKRSLFNLPRKLRFDETMHLGEDQLFQFTYVPRAKSVMVIEDKLYNYRVSRNSSLMQLYSSRKIQKVEQHLVLVEKVIEAWKKEGYYEMEVDNLTTWAVNFIYYTLTNLPLKFKKKYALQFFEIFKKNNVPDYLVADYEQQHFNEMREWTLQSELDEKEADELKKQIKQYKYEIKETLNSKAFRLGRKLTKKEKRIDLTKFEQI